jgi:hypothetical protein
MGQECAACVRGIPGAAKNMQDVDLSKKVVDPIKEVFVKTLKSGQVMNEPEESKDLVTVVEHIESPATASRSATKDSMPKKYKRFQGKISAKLSQKAREVDLNQENEENLDADEVYELDDGTVYQGRWDEAGKKQGQGLEVRTDGSKFVGNFKNSLREGRGRLIYANGDQYEGSFKNGKLEGKGKYTAYEGVVYEGQFKSDMKNGYGKENWPDGSVYEGFFEDNFKHGHGKFLWKDGSSYEGDFKEDKIEGKGIYTWGNGKRYDGTWKNNKMHGFGVFTWPSGRRYEGNYKNDVKDGMGKFTWPDGRVYDGEWENGQQHGLGYYTFLNKKNQKMITRKGRWEAGSRVEWVKDE